MNATPNVIKFPSTESEAPEELFLVKPGKYTAVYAEHVGYQIFGTRKLRVSFILLEYPGILLHRWYRVNTFKGRVSARSTSDLARELSAVLGTRVRHDRIPVGSLANTVVRVEVKTVQQDHRQNSLDPVNRYSVIARVGGKA
jgi:hypothetical protein